MRLKLVLLLFIFSLSKIALAQWASNDNVITQDFGVVASDFVYNSSNLFSVSNGTNQGFLPIPISGYARVSLASSATGNSIKLNGDNSLEMIQGTTTGGGYGKYSVYDLSNTSDVLHQTFNISFNTTSTGGDFNVAIGNYNTGGLFSGSGAIYRSSTEIFTAIKWRMSSGSIISTEYRVGSNASTTTTYQVISTTRFVKGNSYKVDIFANNSGIWQTYTKNGTLYTLPNNTFTIWVDDIKLGGFYPRSIEVSGSDPLSSGTSIALANGIPLNSFLFTASEKSTVSNSSITIKDVSSSYKVASHTPFQILQNFKDNPATAILPDFSYVGYKQGEVGIPDVEDTVFDVTNYGAIPDDANSDQAAIISAINAATAHGSGIIFFPPGKFLINEDGDIHAPININCNNIVFRGSGSGTGGTELFMKNALDPTNPSQLYSTPFMLNFGTSNYNTTIGNVTQSAPKGTFQVTLADTKTLVAGDWIMLKMQSTDTDLLDYDLGGYATDPTWTSLVNGGIEVQVIHQIQSIHNNVITLKTPLTYPIDPTKSWVVSKFANKTEVGIEDIAFVGNFTQPFVHHGSALDDSGFSLVSLSKLTNSWVRNCRFTDVSVGLAIKQGANISVVNSTITGNPGHEAIYNQAGTNVFFGKLTDESGMWHSIGVNALAMNTVIWRCTYPSNTCFESHSSQPRNTLLDFVEGGLSNGRAGGDVSNMPNHLSNLIFWNYKQTNSAVQSFDFWPSTSVYWKIPYPIIVGFRGNQSTFSDLQLKYSESLGSTVNPESLYQEQLKFRLGFQPAWIDELYNASALPISLVSFTGTGEQNGNLLHWTTASEKDNSNFDILKSDNGKDFYFLASLTGSRNSTQLKNYSYTDRGSIANTKYYKLKQVDFNGKSEEFGPIGIKNLFFSNAPKLSINASLQKTSLYIKSPKSGFVTISFFDLSGNKLSEMRNYIGDDLTNLTLPAMPASGVYFIYVSSEFLNVRQKFICH